MFDATCGTAMHRLTFAQAASVWAAAAGVSGAFVPEEFERLAAQADDAVDKHPDPHGYLEQLHEEARRLPIRDQLCARWPPSPATGKG